MPQRYLSVIFHPVSPITKLHESPPPWLSTSLSNLCLPRKHSRGALPISCRENTACRTSDFRAINVFCSMAFITSKVKLQFKTHSVSQLHTCVYPNTKEKDVGWWTEQSSCTVTHLYMRLLEVIPLNSSTTQREGKNSQCKGLFVSNSLPGDKREILL